MSIVIKGAKTLLEKVDAAANLVEQMYLAHMIRDEIKFRQAHEEAGKLLRDSIDMIDKN